MIAWDLVDERWVDAVDGSVDVWRSKAYPHGDRSLVCLQCLRDGRAVPVVIKCRLGGARRPYFSHPRGKKPPAGHHPETTWHLAAKLSIADWARRQPNVVSVKVEARTDDASRRADVDVRLQDGSRLAIEVQYRLLHDHAWRVRHRDYVCNGIVDIWIWHERVPMPWMVADAGLPVWRLDQEVSRLASEVGSPHLPWLPSHDDWVYEPHNPPCVGDTLFRVWSPIKDLAVTRSGLAYRVDVGDVGTLVGEE